MRPLLDIPFLDVHKGYFFESSSSRAMMTDALPQVVHTHAVVQKGGRIEIFAPELPEGTELDVTFDVLSPSERNDTAYLKASPETHTQLMEALRNAEEHPENLIVFTPEEWDAKYNV